MAAMQSNSQVALETSAASWLCLANTWFVKTLTSFNQYSQKEVKTSAATDSPAAGTNSAHLVQIKDDASPTPMASDVSEMRRVFQKIDENNDGLVCADDLLRFMARLGFEMSKAEAASTLDSVDTNGDGRIDFDEFLSLHISLCADSANSSNADILSAFIDEEEDDSTLLEAFRVFDKNEDGIITAQELQTVLSDLGFSEGKSLKSCERMIENADVDGNGVIDILAFKVMLSSNYHFT